MDDQYEVPSGVTVEMNEHDPSGQVDPLNNFVPYISQTVQPVQGDKGNETDPAHQQAILYNTSRGILTGTTGSSNSNLVPIQNPVFMVQPNNVFPNQYNVQNVPGHGSQGRSSRRRNDDEDYSSEEDDDPYVRRKKRRKNEGRDQRHRAPDEEPYSSVPLVLLLIGILLIIIGYVTEIPFIPMVAICPFICGFLFFFNHRNRSTRQYAYVNGVALVLYCLISGLLVIIVVFLVVLPVMVVLLPVVFIFCCICCLMLCASADSK